jgi:hypothetical protein
MNEAIYCRHVVGVRIARACCRLTDNQIELRYVTTYVIRVLRPRTWWSSFTVSMLAVL